MGAWPPVVHQDVKDQVDLKLDSTTASGTYAVVSAAPRSVKDPAFGAVGNGSTDDKAAIDAAQVALPATGGVVFTPPGVYALASSLLLKRSNVTFKGAGMLASKWKGTGAATSIVQASASYPDVTDVAFEDMGFDWNRANRTGGTGTYVCSFYGGYVRRLRFTRCLFENGPDGFLQFNGMNGALVENCLFRAPGTAKSDAVTIQGNAKRVRIHGNDFLYVRQGVVVTGSRKIQVTDNTFDLGWWLGVALFSGSGGAVSYSATVLTDTGAAFTGLATSDVVRVMPTLRTSTGGTVTYQHTQITDTAAAFDTYGINPGAIIRVGSVFAVVQAVTSGTVLEVEEWLSDADRTPVALPADGTAYTVYDCQLGLVASSTATTITVTRFYDLLGTSVTPTAGSRYEIATHPVYAIQSASGTSQLLVSRNTVRRGWADQISVIVGSDIQVSDNTVESGQDTGITVQSVTNPQVTANRIRNQGSAGIICQSTTDGQITDNLITDTGWTCPVGALAGDINLYAAARMEVADNHCEKVTATHPRSEYGILLRSVTTACKIHDNRSRGHVTADVYVDNTIVAGSNELFDNTWGTLTYQDVTLGQVLRTSGAGAPTLPAAVGSEYVRTNGGAGGTKYVKESGSDANGWTAFSGVGGTDTGLLVARQTATANAGWNNGGDYAGAFLGQRNYTSDTASGHSIEWDVIFGGGAYALDWFQITDTINGIYTFLVDGVSVGTIDGYNAGGITFRKDSLTGVAIGAGRRRLKVEITTKNTLSGAYQGNFSALAYTRTGA